MCALLSTLRCIVLQHCSWAVAPGVPLGHTAGSTGTHGGNVRNSRQLVAVVLLAVALLTGVSSSSRAANAGGLTLGSGMGFSILMFDESSDLVTFSAPEGNQLFGATPGLRFGHVSPSRGFEFGLGAGMLYLNPESGESFHILVFGLDFQKHFVNQSNWNLFIGADGGISSSEFLTDTTQPYVGAMIGARNVISDDNGSVKFALHFRHHMEDEDEFVQGFNEVTLAMHFDLWIPD
jgi:hypothetical protein